MIPIRQVTRLMQLVKTAESLATHDRQFGTPVGDHLGSG